MRVCNTPNSVLSAGRRHKCALCIDKGKLCSDGSVELICGDRRNKNEITGLESKCVIESAGHQKKKKDKNLLLGRQNKNPEKESRGKI